MVYSDRALRLDPYSFRYHLLIIMLYQYLVLEDLRITPYRLFPSQIHKLREVRIKDLSFSRLDTQFRSKRTIERENQILHTIVKRKHDNQSSTTHQNPDNTDR